MKDKSKNTTDLVMPGLMFEELIGTLLLAQDEVLAANKALADQEEESWNMGSNFSVCVS